MHVERSQPVYRSGGPADNAQRSTLNGQHANGDWAFDVKLWSGTEFRYVSAKHFSAKNLPANLPFFSNWRCNKLPHTISEECADFDRFVCRLQANHRLILLRYLLRLAVQFVIPQRF